MTHHMLSQFDGAKSLPSSASTSHSMEETCAFCQIVERSQPAHVVYEDDATLAFLDILPLRRGHTLVIPKHHVRTISELEPEQAAAVACALVKVARAVGRAMDNDRLQVITNQVYAQVVPHVHFHIVPAPPLPSSSSRSASSSTPSNTATPSNPMALMGLGHGRDELDDQEAAQLVKLICQRIEADAVEKAKL